MFEILKKISPMNAEFFRPLGKCKRFSLGSHPARASSIRGLFVPRNPCAVNWRIVAINIFSFKCVSRRAWSHVAQKVGEIIQPFRSHFNPAPTVIFIPLIFGIHAAPFGSSPSNILFGFGPSVSNTRHKFSFDMKTPTALGMSTNQMIRDYIVIISANAAATPNYFLPLCPTNVLDNCQSSKYQPCQFQFNNFHERQNT